MRIFLLTTATVVTLGLGTVSALACGMEFVPDEAMPLQQTIDLNEAVENNVLGTQGQAAFDAISTEMTSNAVLMKRDLPVGSTFTSLSETAYSGSGNYTVDVGTAFQRLDLQADLEEFYAGVLAQAEGLSEEDKVELFRSIEPQLTELIYGRPQYQSVSGLDKGAKALDEAKADLAQRLGLSEVPA